MSALANRLRRGAVAVADTDAAASRLSRHGEWQQPGWSAAALRPQPQSAVYCNPIRMKSLNHFCEGYRFFPRFDRSFLRKGLSNWAHKMPDYWNTDCEFKGSKKF